MSRRPAAPGGSSALTGGEPVVALPRLPLERVPSLGRLLRAAAFGIAMAALALSWELLPLLTSRLTKHTAHWSPWGTLLVVAVFAGAGFLVSYLGLASSGPAPSREESA